MRFGTNFRKALTYGQRSSSPYLEREASGKLGWHFGEAEVRRISQPTLSVLGGESDALRSRLGETHRLLLEWLPHAEGFVLPDRIHFMQI